MSLTKKQQKIIQEVHDFVKRESINFSEDDVFKNHILGVKNYATRLARLYKADLFVVTLAAYLHDIYHLQTKNHEIHEVEGAKFVLTYLKKYNLSLEEIQLVSKCVLNHRGSKDRKRESIEEKIISCADAMDHINRFQHMFYRKCQTMSYENAMEWMRGKIARGWKKIELPKARKIVKNKYEAAKLAFEII